MRVSPINNQPFINKIQTNNNSMKNISLTNVNFASASSFKPQANADKTLFSKVGKFIKEKFFDIASFMLTVAFTFLLRFILCPSVKEPEKIQFNTKEEAIEYSINKIIKSIKEPNAKEYAVVLDYNDFSVMYENAGDENSVRAYSREMYKNKIKGIEKPFIALHGHPMDYNTQNGKPATQTFSYQDFRLFNNDKNCKEDYVINNLGQYCLLRKMDDFSPLSNAELKEIEKKFLDEFVISWPNKVYIYDDKGNVLHEFHDYQGMHRFWNNVANKYNCEYYTTFGVYDGKDAYIDKYYPEIKDDIGDMSSHRTFKQ